MLCLRLQIVATVVIAAVASVLFSHGAAAQVITSVSGPLSHGSSMTLSGSAFGSKPTAAPVVWDNVESGGFNPKWHSTHALVVSAESRHANSQRSGTVNFQGNLQSWPPPPDGLGYGGNGYFTGPNSVLGERWFAQYWFKLDSNFDWGSGDSVSGGNLANIKVFRMWNPDNIDENFSVATMGYAGGGVGYLTEYVANPQGRQYFGDTDDWTKGVWHLFQFEFRESSLGGNDGVFRWWVDGVLFADDRDIMTREDYADLKRPFILGFYNSWSDSGADRDDFYIDDAYIDNSWARVEIGNNAVYSLCTHREIQIPSAWSNSQITATVNLGSFAAASPLYIFVVNTEGNVSAGYPLTGGLPTPTPDTIGPEAPTNLR